MWTGTKGVGPRWQALRRTLSDEQVRTLLAATPGRLKVVSVGVSKQLLRTSSAEGGWSANDVLAHLRSCADVWGASIDRLVAEDSPTIRAVNPTTWIAGTDYPAWEFADALQAFTTERTRLLNVLGEADWSRAGTFTGAGRPLTRTVGSFAERLARHERPHVKQVERALA